MDLIETDGGTAERYGSIRRAAGLSKKAFADSLGIHPVVSGDIELGKREPSREVLVRLARCYGTDINWLLTGSNAPSAGFQSSETENGLAQVQLIVQEAAAGAGAEIDGSAAVSTLPVPQALIAPYRSSRIRAVTVRGDSMTGIGLGDRDIVLFCPDETAGDGVFVLSVGSTLLVKRLSRDPVNRELSLISENPQYPVRRIAGEELEQVRIEGRVVAWMHRHN